jgi:hypothetical protein
MKTCTRELRKQQKYDSPPGMYFMTQNQTGKNVVAWWYTCRNVI